MKKHICLFLAVGLLVCLCGCQSDNTQSVDEASDPVETSSLIEASAPIESTSLTESTSSIESALEERKVDEDSEETLSEKLIREIDGAYSEESKLPEYCTTGGMIELADKYAAKWKQTADEYYNKIIEYDGIVQLDDDAYSSDDFHTFVSNMKTNWEQYYQKQCEDYAKVLQSIYGRGTVVGPIFANYKYEMQKDWALQVVGIYVQLYIE